MTRTLRMHIAHERSFAITDMWYILNMVNKHWLCFGLNRKKTKWTATMNQICAMYYWI